MKIQFPTVFLIFLTTWLNAQITGKVIREDGEALPYAGIYIQGTTTGTSTNEHGEYLLKLKPGIYPIVFQYVGYKTQVHQIRVGTDTVVFDVRLKPEIYAIDEVTIFASGEDPAYAIIRKAIEKRKYYLRNIQQYQCDVYIKGNHKLLKAPEKILGREIGDLEGILDSNRQGIVYLSESIAKYYFQAPDNRKEVMVSSKVSGDDRGYSFNSATEMDVNFYRNTLELNRQIVSPIADNALSYYNYKLLGADMDESGRLINMIRVIPKRKFDPVVSGTIYIVEDLWNIQSLELHAGKDATQLYFMDSISVRQVHVPVGNEDQWMVFTNYISFGLSLFGFELYGQFTGIYTDYDLEADIDPRIFNADLLVVEKESNQKADSFWFQTRPVPLLKEEIADYRKRDSISLVRDSPEFKDSLDREDNKWNFGDLLGTYEYRRRNKLLFVDVESPISNTAFNTVQGFHMSLKGRVLKYFDEDRTRRVLFWPEINYGFSEKSWRPKLRFEYRFNRLNASLIGMDGGRDAPQFDNQEPISPSLNTLYSLFLRRNHMKIYDRKFLRIYGRSEVKSGLFLSGYIEYAHRKSLMNYSEYSFFNEKTRTYETNHPLTILGEEPFDTHRILKFKAEVQFRFGQKYYRYPDRKFTVENNNPVFSISYDYGIPMDAPYPGFHQLDFSVGGDVVNGVRGQFSYYANLGFFIQSGREKGEDIPFVDFKHFLGQEILIGNPSGYTRRFLLLPYYEYSTSENYFQAHGEYQFKGWILDKIPAINSLGLGLVAGGNFLYVPGKPEYGELYIGIDQIGFSFVRLLRLDFVFSFHDTEEFDNFGIRLGLGF